MKRNLTLKNLLLFSGLVLLMASCRRDEVLEPVVTADRFDSEVYHAWNEAFLEIDRFAPGYRPPAAARMLAYTGLAAYEAIVPGMPGYRTLQANFSGLNIPAIDHTAEYHWPLVVNAAYATMFRLYFPHVAPRFKDEIDKIERLMNEEYRSTVSNDVFSRSVTRGQNVANVVYQWSISDTYGHNAYLDPRPASYIPPVGPGLWQPTFPDFSPGLFPFWGKVRSFAMKEGDKVARPPLPFSETPNTLFYLQAKEAYAEVKDISFEKKWIAEFWSDDIFEQTFEPAARWVAIANQVVDKENPNLSKAAELYAKLGMSLADCGIAIWNSKYIYNVERPVSYIRRVFDPNWITILNNTVNGVQGMTPEFPAYPSGHSGFGAAAAGILIDMFGFNYTLTDRCHEFRSEFIGTPRTFYSFSDMAYENAISRIYLGVHYRMDCEEGLRLGYLAAKRVNELPFKR
jgi:membrane-associated phospholipid phosphatase